MLNGMAARPLLIASILEYAERYHSQTEIVSETTEGPRYRGNWAECGRRSRRLARALHSLGVKPGDRVATMAWNTHRHVELYYAVSGIGAICHTVNPRLFVEQLIYIFNHARDGVVFTDLTFVPLFEKLQPHLETVQVYVILTDAVHMPETSLPNTHCYETLLAAESDDYSWPTFDENTPSSLCYTSGTTGDPKGALYSHRSTVLHTMALCSGNVTQLSVAETILPVVPMFHVNAWGVPYAAPMAGAKLVLNGPRFDPPSLVALFDEENVTLSLGVPTIWSGLLRHLDETGHRFKTLREVLIGGAALPRAMIEALETRHGVRARQGWGMTEMSPLGAVCALKPHYLSHGDATRFDQLARQGVCLYGVDYRVVDEDGHVVAHDGHHTGELQVRGHWVIASYYNDAAATANAFDADGWFRTGDVVTIDADGYMQIVDRSKDLIKSGGEWVSSVEVENVAMSHPAIAEAAVIGVKDERWSERPLLCAVLRPNSSASEDELREFLHPHMAPWAVPDHVVFLPDLPHGATGKVYKRKLREMYPNNW